MEINGCLIFSSTSLFTPKFSINAYNNKNPHRFHMPTSKFHRTPSFLLYLPSSTTGKSFQVSAHFGGGHMRRRNSLRKKLIDDQKVRQNPISLDLEGGFNDTESFRESSDDGGVKKSDFVDDGDVVECSSVEETETKRLGESVLLRKLENWVDQFKKDSECWGIGTGHIFTVYQDLKGNVERVLVNEDEILKRSRVRGLESAELTNVNSKILYAKSLAREMKEGNNVIPRNSSVAKFVTGSEKSGFVNMIRHAILQPEFLPKLSRVGRMVLFGFIAVWALKNLLETGNKNDEYTEMEKEMMRRKLKARQQKEKEKELLVKGSVEVVGKLAEPAVLFEKPKLDKQELMNCILKAKSSMVKPALLDSSSLQSAKSVDLDDKIQEIREMALRARQIESGEHSLVDQDEEETPAITEELPRDIEELKENREDGLTFLSDLPNRELGQDVGEPVVTMSLDEPKSDDTGNPRKVGSVPNGAVLTNCTSNFEVLKDRQSTAKDLKGSETPSLLTDTNEATESSDTSGTEPCLLKERFTKKNLKVIRSVKEAREYLSRKHGTQESNQHSQVKIQQERSTLARLSSNKELGRNKSQLLNTDNNVLWPSGSNGAQESTCGPSAGENSTANGGVPVPIQKNGPVYSEEEYGKGKNLNQPISSECTGTAGNEDTRPSVKTENWIEKNFHEVEPVLEKIGVGFRDNFMVAREKKASQQLNLSTDIAELGSTEDGNELEWMKDDKLREIVFQVRENELAGRDPFYLMDAEDKLAFFQGLQKKVEKENEKLSHVHEWLHSNIENVDYGADGISLYDPLEKIVPRWKGPPLERNLEFLNDYTEQRKAIFSGNGSIVNPVNKDEDRFPQKLAESSDHENAATCLVPNNRKRKNKVSKDPKTVIETSDGAVRPGKKSAKEYWQHTKKWSRGFLESYNAEVDPELKSIMKDMGKDLDRWITEKEVQDAADLMEKLPEKNKQFIEKKLNKLKREMELFGPHAVVSKYSEYAEGKEEDYLWWLDLPHVLCIELYTIQDGEQKIGFYSLEMAADLELDPKPYHVIAFEDAGNCKNFCYIIQAHLDMLGNGRAFVVPRTPKDAFQEAKGNGFGVTVIRKGELQLNVDQTLEEVEEQITEIGSKIYHDKIMRQRSVDISSLMKGVFGASGKPSKRKNSKRKLKKPRKK